MLKKNSRIFIAGHKGLVGSSLIRRMNFHGYNNIIVRSKKQLDLRNQNKVNIFFKKNKINLVVDQKYFPTSLNKIQKLNVEFSASFGRQLEYYTGMVFKIDIKSKSKNINIINGGRYDKLISDLGSKKQVPAVGAALNLNY